MGWEWLPWVPDGYDQSDWTRDNLEGYTSPNTSLNTGLNEAGLGGAVGSEAQKVKDQTTYNNGKTAFKDLPKRKIKFNPPLHTTMRPKGSSTLYAPRFGAGDKKQVWENPDKRTSGEWRLGHIVGGDEVLKAYKDDPELKYRHGFRFLYNPTSITMNAAINKNISPNALKDGSGLMLISAAGIGTITLELLLNRIPEVNAPDKGDLTEQEEDLRDKGTMVDLDYLFRVANGTWGIVQGFGSPIVKVNKKGDGKHKRVKDSLQAEYVAETGDIGVLVPTPAWLTLGPGLRYYGWMQSVTYKHTMFSAEMVPMITRVTIVFQRIFKGTRTQLDELDTSASQASVISGDVFEPPPDTKARDPRGSAGEEQYPADHRLKKWESDILQGPGTAESVKNTVAAIRALAEEFPDAGINNAYRASDGIDDHYHGLALDIAPGSKQGTLIDSRGNEKVLKSGDDICGFFIKNAKRFGVCYMMWDRDIWAEYSPGWREGGGVVGPPPTDTHQDHIHICFYPYADYSGRSGRPSYKGEIHKGTYWDETLGGGEGLPPLIGSPKKIGIQMTEYARKHGWPGIDYTTATAADYAGHRGGSWHYGPYHEKWAGDFGDALGSPSACRKLAEAISDNWNMGWTWDKGLVNATVDGYLLELIHGNYPNHDNHVHFGVRVINSRKVYGTSGT